MKPAIVIKIMLVESPIFAKNRPARNNEMDNTFTCLLLQPNKPINKLPINIPDAQIDSVIPVVFGLVNERSIGIKSDCNNPTKNKTIIMIPTYFPHISKPL